jgi:hypothetical protein
MKSLIVETNKVFTKLRRKGFWAQRGLCCMTCTINIIPDKETEYVFYHSQDAESAKKYGYMYIAYGSNKKSATEIDDFLVGYKVVEEFKKSGLIVDWNNSASSRIKVSLPA